MDEWQPFIDPSEQPPDIKMQRGKGRDREVREATAEEEAEYVAAEAW